MTRINRRRAMENGMKGLPALLCLSMALQASATETPVVQDLAWLAGCWASSGREAGSGEQWTVPAGGTMLGIARTIRENRTVAHEFLRIRETDAGEIEFIASPSGQAEATFRLTRVSTHEVVFENPAHDFPQRILYRLHEGGILHARIEGEIDGVTRAADFPMHRVDCEPAPSSN